MKDFVGVAVTHRALGKGKIISVHGDRIDIQFEHAERTFVFPDAFVDYLETEDSKLSEAIQQGLDTQQKDQNAKKAQDKILSDLKAYIEHEQELAAKPKPKRKPKKKE